MDEERLLRALRNAHNAGDTKAAQRIAGMIREQRAAQQQPEDAPSQLESGLRGGVQGLSMGFSDEAGAGVRAGLNYITGGAMGQPYDEALEQQRALNEAAQEANPNTYLGGQVAGGVAGALVPATRAVGLGARGVGLGARSLRGAALGAAGGGAAGVGYGEGAEDSVQGGVTGAIAGALIGGAAPGVMGALRGGARRAGRAVGLTAPEPPAAVRVLAQNADVDEISNLPQGAMLADADSVRPMLNVTAQRVPSGAARDRLSQRISGASQRVMGELDDTLGEAQGIRATSRNIARAGSEAGGSIAERAYAQTVDLAGAPDVNAALQRVEPNLLRRALNEASAALQDETGRLQRLGVDVADDGTLSFARNPTVRELHEVKRALQTIAEESRDSITGRMTAEGRRASRQARNLRQSLGEAVPDYDEAMRLFQPAQEAQAALQSGRRALSPSVTRETVQEDIADLAEEGVRAYRQGLRNEIARIVDNARSSASNPDIDAAQMRKIISELSSKASRDKLRIILGESEANRVIDAVSDLQTAAGTYNQLARNSDTFLRLSTDQAIDDAARGPIARTANALANTEPTVRGVAARAGRTADAALGGRRVSDRTREMLQDMVTRSGPAADDVRAQIARLLENQQRSARNTRLADQLAGAMGRGAVGAFMGR